MFDPEPTPEDDNEVGPNSPHNPAGPGELSEGKGGGC